LTSVWWPARATTQTPSTDRARRFSQHEVTVNIRHEVTVNANQTSVPSLPMLPTPLDDAHAADTLVVGLGREGKGWMEIKEPRAPFANRRWLRVNWTEYNDAVGETRPVLCNLDEQGHAGLVVGLGAFPRSGGWLEIFRNPGGGWTHAQWLRVPWAAYNAMNGETFPACGDVDGDGRDEIVVGLGRGGRGWVFVFDDATTGYRPLPATPISSAPGWLHLDWPYYTEHSESGGEVRPSAGNLDADAAAEIALGLGPGSGGWVLVLDDAGSRFAPLAGTPGNSGWLQVQWSQYTQAMGETRPVICDLNNDGRGELVLGLGPFPPQGGWINVLGDATSRFAPFGSSRGWTRLTWPAYNAAHGATLPGCTNLDDDPGDELVIGLGQYPANGGWLEIQKHVAGNLSLLSWARVQWDAYNRASGLTRPAGSSGREIAQRLIGLNFSPYVDGQDPNLGSVVNEAQLRTRLQIVAPYTQWVRTFGSTHGLERTGAVARSLGLKVALGAWLGRDRAANGLEIDNVIEAARAVQAGMVIVGSEVLLRGDLTESELLAHIQQVRAALPGIPVTTADVYGQLLAHPAIVAAVDVVLVNYYPYWEGVPIQYALASLHRHHQQIVAAAGGKPIVVSETGWPTCGNTVGQAVPSLSNAAFYYLNFVSWARANAVSFFYFSALDETWKARYEGPQGACWGVWDKNGSLKAGMHAVFDGQLTADNWSGTVIVGGPGTPSVEFTYLPPYGSFDDLRGRVAHVRPNDHRVAVYIKVGSGWWTKPTFADPVTSIWPDGTWSTDITTGGADHTATAIAAFLIPAGYHPPAASGGATLPPELLANAVASFEVTRTP
jgi:exo-beta-1,3-glucanase (GH17 family)